MNPSTGSIFSLAEPQGIDMPGPVHQFTESYGDSAGEELEYGSPSYEAASYEEFSEEQPFPAGSHYEQVGYRSEDLIGGDAALGEREGDPARSSAAADQLIVTKLPLLAGHAGTPPDLVLAWNAYSPGQAVDVVVHLHGFSGRGRAMSLPEDMVPVSGLNLSDPDHPGIVGRSTPTLLVLPRGHFFGGKSGHGYTFPALQTPGALAALVDDARARVAARTGMPLGPGRLILTAHSGGGASLMRILNYADPDEVHTFDALYTSPASLIAWARRRIGAGSGALRVIYRPGEGTAANSAAVQAAVSAALTAAGRGPDPRFRVEQTSVAHMQIPRRFGWRLLADVAADLPGAGAAPARRSRPRRAPARAHERYSEFDSGEYGTSEFGSGEYDSGEAGCGCGHHREEAAAPRRKNLTTAQVRRAWAQYACAESSMVEIKLLSHTTPVNPLTVKAFRALAQALTDTGYKARKTWVYNCRDIAVTKAGAAAQRSLHAYGLAVDIDAATNPHRHGVHGKIVFSPATTQAGREQDVRAGRAGTAFTEAQVEAVEAIRTVDGLAVFGWGGRWRSSHDAMHFEIRLTPAELGVGLAAPVAVGHEVPRTCEAYELPEYELSGELNDELYEEEEEPEYLAPY
jgi:hypothetical protein